METATADLKPVLRDALEGFGCVNEDANEVIVERVANKTESMLGRGIAEHIMQESAQLDATDAITEALAVAVRANPEMLEAALGIIRFHLTRPVPDFTEAPLPEDLETWALGLVGLESPNVVRFNGEVTTALLETALHWVDWPAFAGRLLVGVTA